MDEFLRLIFQGLLDWLGIDAKQQFVLWISVYFAVFFVYAGRQFKVNPIYSVLYLAGGLAALLFLFSETERGRMIGGWTFAAATAAAFGWYFARRDPAGRGDGHD